MCFHRRVKGWFWLFLFLSDFKGSYRKLGFAEVIGSYRTYVRLFVLQYGKRLRGSYRKLVTANLWVGIN